VGDIWYLWATFDVCVYLTRNELGRGHPRERFELAAEVGRLFEAKFKSHNFDRLS
jgi:hypothetical protein